MHGTKIMCYWYYYLRCDSAQFSVCCILFYLKDACIWLHTVNSMSYIQLDKLMNYIIQIKHNTPVIYASFHDCVFDVNQLNTVLKSKEGFEIFIIIR